MVYKTWEMLRDIKQEEVWFVEGDTLKFSVELNDYNELVYSDTKRTVVVNDRFRFSEWIKQPKLVDFPEAWKAYEEGKTIRPALEQFGYYKPSKGSETSTFTPAEIRSKWEILE